ncbi:putative thiazole-containing bacteriocin maturation protein [Brevibacillus reuszeri]|uniref:putative thiazole-containing bacteriocin maturation protein n=1 Tax=Brevibacillus reuszeri TaxID=54915 RepID=UPI002898DF33|nr:putative thiazole-containing bacteriocin maturation protein [Brevibacillus reuszeri]
MANLNPAMRLKVKRDTFYLPNPDGSVYFRNNIGTFQMEGEMIDQWVERLLPMFNGEHTLEEITDDLPEEYQKQIFEIANSLFQNGFVQDKSKDIPHQLPAYVQEVYGAQIAFLDEMEGSGGYLFQSYRSEKALAVGSGPFFLALISALLESGKAQFHYWITDNDHTNRKRLEELIAYARQKDPDVELTELYMGEQTSGTWREAISPFSAVLYVSEKGEMNELIALQSLCKENGKVFIPATFSCQRGIAGPLVHSSSEACFESAWRRLHQSSLGADPMQHSFSMTAAALLANVIVFEWFKYTTGLSTSDNTNKLYLLNLETLEGGWKSFLPHPLVKGLEKLQKEKPSEQLLQAREKQAAGRYHSVFHSWTSEETGIFHTWEEGELKQLPLAQCQVQSVDPLSSGPAELLPVVVCAGLTHDEARKEAGLAGVEMYVSRIVHQLLHEHEDMPFSFQKAVGFGAGETVEEGLCRALRHCLTEVFGKQQGRKITKAARVQITSLDDKRSQFYLRSLATMGEKPIIGIGEKVLGFPVYWVCTKKGWHGSVGLDDTEALRSALLYALMEVQNQPIYNKGMYSLSTHAIDLTESEKEWAIFTKNDVTDSDRWNEAQIVLKRHNKCPVVFSSAVEPFLREGLGGVFALLLREEGT